MLDELAAEMRARQAQIGSLRIAFEHLHRSPTYEHFDFLEPTHERDRLLHLIEDRVGRSALPVPATALHLSSGHFLPLVLEEADLFVEVSAETAVQALLERLQERFGAAAVYGVRAVAEHRPERAWAIERQNGVQAPHQSPPCKVGRPLWLLAEPILLSSLAARSHYRGSLELCSEPERIESGWWDEQDVGRDYYTAVNVYGQRLWVFRDRHSRSWYLHGLFG
jgi:protein ImuB